MRLRKSFADRRCGASTGLWHSAAGRWEWRGEKRPRRSVTRENCDFLRRVPFVPREMLMVVSVVPIPTRSWFFLEKKRKVMWRAKCRKWTHFSFGSVLRVTQSSQPGCKWVKCMRTGYPSLAFVRTAARVIGLYDTCYAGSTRWLCALIIIIIHDCSGVPRVFNLWRDLYRRTLLEVHLAQRMGCREPPFSLLLTDVVRQKWQL